MDTARRWLGLFPLSGLGLLVLALSAWAWWGLGVGRGDLLLRTLGSVGLVLVGVAVLSVVLGALRVARLLRALDGAPPLEVEVGLSADTGLSPSLPWWLPFIGMDLAWDEPAAAVRVERARGGLAERIRPTRRGEAAHIVRRVTVEDLFGLARVRFTHREARACRFQPSRGALHNIDVVQGMSGGDALAHPDGPPVGDPMDLRSYGAGDPIRFVLWKVFARTRDLVVRTPEQALAPERRTVAYLVAGPGDEPAAGAARVAIESGVLGAGWQMGADGLGEAVRDRRAALEAIVESAAVAPVDGGRGLSAFLASLTGPMPRVMVFVPSVPGPWLERVVQTCAGAPGLRVDFLVCADGIAPARRAGLADWVFTPPPRDALPPADPVALGRVVGALDPLGRVIVVDRQAGAVHPAAHLRALRRAS